ncbi:MAG: conserved phage C-terminal domain-containing protein [Deltaproteobacteria bacterium]|nr:conserved phage C-terminal domain-containing protein [Deltaproteobacteria bacterium]
MSTSKSVGYQEIILHPGQFIFGRKAAAKELGLSEQEIRTSVELLKKADNLTIKSTNKFSVISIVNWTIYQGNGGGEQPSNQPTTNQQVTTNKNDKKISKKISKISIERNNILIRHHGDEKVPLSEGIKEILDLLNEKRVEILGRNGLRPITTDHDIKARLKEGASVYQCCRVVDTKSKDPYFRENPKYFHPATLFRKANFQKYLDEAELLKDAHGPHDLQ